MKSIIITSTGRTGTYFLYRLLSDGSHDCKAFHNSRNTALINILSNQYLSGLLSEYLLRRAWRFLKYNEIANYHDNTYIDSNNHLYALVSIAPDLYPNLSVVHMIRDPRDYVRSHLNWAYSRNKSYFANFFIPFWQPNGFLVSEVRLFRWLNMSWFERFCWIWDFKNRYINQVEEIGVPYRLFRVEDFFLNIVSVYEELSDFIGLEIRASRDISRRDNVNQSTANKIPHWTKWPDRDCAILHSWCGELMEKHEYGLESEWLDKVGRGRVVMDKGH